MQTGSSPTTSSDEHQRDSGPSAAIILLGRGMPHGEQWASLRGLAEDLRLEHPQQTVRIAFLEMTEPGLETILQDLTSEGFERAVIVPCFVPFDRNVAGWLPRRLAARRAAGEMTIEVALASPVEAAAAYREAVRQAVASGENRPDVTATHKPLPRKEARTGVPLHRSQIFVCLGPRCAEAGAWEVLATLRRSLRTLGLDKAGEARTLVCRSSCLFPCSYAPALLVQPSRTWYGRVAPEDVDDIARRHLRDGEPVQHLIIEGNAVEEPSDWPTAQVRKGDVVVDGVFARAAMRVPGAMAVFGAIACVGSSGDTLLSVRSPLAERFGIHGPDTPHEVVAAPEIAPQRIERAEPLNLVPGGLHMMLFDCRRDLTPGDSFPLELVFEKAGTVCLDVPFQPGGMG